MKYATFVLILLWASLAAGQTTLTLTGNTTYSALTASTTTSLANDVVNLGNYVLTLDGTATTTYNIGTITTAGSGSLTITNTASGLSLTTGSLQSGTNNVLTLTNSNAGLIINAGSVTGVGNSSAVPIYNSTTGTSTITLNLTGTASNLGVLNSTTGTLNIVGGTLLGNPLYSVDNAGSGMVTLSGCTVIGGSGYSAVFNSNTSGKTRATNCNLIFSVYPPVNHGLTVVASNANNYTQYPTLTGTINFPSAATIMGPWSITNNAQGTATWIGPWHIDKNLDGSYNVGPYAVH